MSKLSSWKTVFFLCVFCAVEAISPRAQTLTTLYSFCSQGGTNCTDGAGPLAGVIQGSDGNFYGTTANGGAHDYDFCANGIVGCGTVFKITPSGTQTTIYDFCAKTACADGANPYGALVLGTDGNLYGTTRLGGATDNCPNGCGTIFTITLGGALTTLHNFAGADGANPYAALVQDGNFYGTTYGGGTNGSGTIFSITPGGSLTPLYNFAGADGANPYGGLVLGTDGNLYGTTLNGGTSGLGTIFSIAPGGSLTPLYNFAGGDGANPAGGLVLGNDGNLYGTTLNGGTYADGTIFSISLGGSLTPLHYFNLADGAGPWTLVQGTDGNFYGTTQYGGANAPPYCQHGSFTGCGTIFEITVEGALTTLYSFGGTDGLSPFAGLVQSTNGSFYGTTNYGGASAGNITYDVNQTIGAGGVTGDIVTNGAIGIFTDAEDDVVNWNLLLNDGTNSVDLTPSNSVVFSIGPPTVSATATQLLFNFSATSLSYLLFESTAGPTDGYLCFVSTYCETATPLPPPGSGAEEVSATPNLANFQATILSGTQVIGTATTTTSVGTVFSLAVGLGPFVKTVPTSGGVGTAVMILGNNLTGATSVSFNGTAATFTVVSDTEIQTTVPTGATTGAVQVTTPSGTLNSNVPFQVTAATLVSIAVAPATASIKAGTTQAFTATGTYSDTSTQDITSTVTWASSNTAAATIVSGGVATGVAAGTSMITASLSGITSNSATL
ncbi:MAG: choice-of-anchor tandem repeat GloVer-containing protein, partial [Terriglobia bacterium]